MLLVYYVDVGVTHAQLQMHIERRKRNIFVCVLFVYLFVEMFDLYNYTF